MLALSQATPGRGESGKGVAKQQHKEPVTLSVLRIRSRRHLGQHRERLPGLAVGGRASHRTSASQARLQCSISRKGGKASRLGDGALLSSGPGKRWAAHLSQRFTEAWVFKHDARLIAHLTPFQEEGFATARTH